MVPRSLQGRGPTLASTVAASATVNPVAPIEEGPEIHIQPADAPGASNPTQAALAAVRSPRHRRLDLGRGQGLDRSPRRIDEPPVEDTGITMAAAAIIGGNKTSP